MIATADLVLNGIVYCLKGMTVTVETGNGKYSIVKRMEKDGENSNEICFKVSNDLIQYYFAETLSYPQDINS